MKGSSRSVWLRSSIDVMVILQPASRQESSWSDFSNISGILKWILQGPKLLRACLGVKSSAPKQISLKFDLENFEPPSSPHRSMPIRKQALQMLHIAWHYDQWNALALKDSSALCFIAVWPFHPCLAQGFCNENWVRETQDFVRKGKHGHPFPWELRVWVELRCSNAFFCKNI